MLDQKPDMQNEADILAPPPDAPEVKCKEARKDNKTIIQYD